MAEIDASLLTSHLSGDRAERMFRGLLESAPDAMVIVGSDGRIVLVNRQTEQLFNWDRESLIGQPVEVLVPIESRERHRAHRRTFTADPQVRPMGVGLFLWSAARPEAQACEWIRTHTASFPQVLSPPRGPTAASVLIVEDEGPVRELVSEILADDDRLRVVGRARDGREAIALARHHQPDLVLLDLAMPGIGGLEALPLIRAVSPGAAVIILSGLDDPDVRERARHAGASGFLVKAVDLVDLPDRLLAVSA